MLHLNVEHCGPGGHLNVDLVRDLERVLEDAMCAHHAPVAAARAPGTMADRLSMIASTFGRAVSGRRR